MVNISVFDLATLKALGFHTIGEAADFKLLWYRSLDKNIGKKHFIFTCSYGKLKTSFNTSEWQPDLEFSYFLLTFSVIFFIVGLV